jgi:uncharacterized membrane protein (UPF0136 family)
MTPSLVLWIYIVLLVVGGLMGFLKAQSRISLFTSLGFAAVLSLINMNIIQVRHLRDILLAVLLVFFGWRFGRMRKFMPMGMMAVVTVITLAVIHLLP